MRKQSASSTAASGNRRGTVFIVIAFVAAAVLGWTLLAARGPTYTLDGQGLVSLSCPVPAVREDVLQKDGTVTVSRIVYRSGDQDVYALLAAPEKAASAIIIVPGAGVRKEAHEERAKAYARAGIATLVLDTRGNGGETAGPAQQVADDCMRFRNGDWPVFYRLGCDISAVRSILYERFHTDVYVMGESNGGRFAAFAAAADPRISGYVGVSTSGFDRYGLTVGGSDGVFIESIDPDHLIHRISPRPVWVLHAPEDPIIPLADSIRLYRNAGEPREFVNFSGIHGINANADEWVIRTFGVRQHAIG